MTSVSEKAEAKYGRYFCRSCASNDKVAPAEERYSMRVYAGMYCESCWAKDGRNHDREYDFLDAGEYLDEQDY